MLSLVSSQYGGGGGDNSESSESQEADNQDAYVPNVPKKRET